MKPQHIFAFGYIRTPFRIPTINDFKATNETPEEAAKNRQSL